MRRINRKMAMLVAVVVAVAGIVVSNLLPGSAGTASGEGSSLASKVTFAVGGLAALAFLALVAVEAWSRLRRRNATGVGT